MAENTPGAKPVQKIPEYSLLESPVELQLLGTTELEDLVLKGAEKSCRHCIILQLPINHAQPEIYGVTK